MQREISFTGFKNLIINHQWSAVKNYLQRNKDNLDVRNAYNQQNILVLMVAHLARTPRYIKNDANINYIIAIKAIELALNFQSKTVIYEDKIITPQILFILKDAPNFFKSSLKNPLLDINFQDVDGNTALHLAAGKGQIDFVKQLLKQRKINSHLKNKAGLKADEHAESLEYYECKSLIQTHQLAHPQTTTVDAPANLLHTGLFSKSLDEAEQKENGVRITKCSIL